MQGLVLLAGLRGILLEFSGIFFNRSLLFELSDLPFRGCLYFYIPINEGNSLKEAYRVIEENALRRRRSRNGDFSFRGPISEVIKEVNLELVVGRPPQEAGRVSDFNGFAGEQMKVEKEVYFQSREKLV